MAAIYGHRWTSARGESDYGDTWLHGLAGVSPAQLAAGMRNAIKISADRHRLGRDDWPPTLGQFRAYCTPAPAVRETAEAALRLPAPVADPSVAERELDRMRRLLGMRAWPEPAGDKKRDKQCA
jgi:hypothetical protein